MTETDQTPGRKPFWTKWTVGGALSIGLAAVAGFASPEVRKATCLELPSAADLEYPRDEATLLLGALDTNTEQRLLDGKKIRFQARVFGETSLRTFYSGVLPSDLVEGHVAANIRPLDYTDTGTPLGGSELSQPPLVGTLVPDSLAAQLAGSPPGAVVEFEGTARYFVRPAPGSIAARNAASLPAGISRDISMSVPDWADFYVVVDSLRVVPASNAPANRLLCRLFHDVPE